MKNRLFLIVPALLLAATPAFATSSIHCHTRGGPDIWLSVSDSPGEGTVQATVRYQGQEIVTGTERGAPRVTRSIVNPRRLSLVVVPAGGRGVLMNLTATKRGVPYLGTVTWRSRTWPVRCFWDEDDPG